MGKFFSNIKKSIANVGEGSSELLEKGTRGAFALANTGTEGVFTLANETVADTLKTINVTEKAANEITQDIVTVGQASIKSAANIAKEGAKTSEVITTQGLQLASSVAITGTDIAKTGLDQTKSITTEGMKAVGQLTTTSISLTKNSLFGFIGRVDNLLASNSASIIASKQRNEILDYKKIYEQLKSSINNTFKTEIGKFIYNFKNFANNQKKLFDVLLDVYKMKFCNSGKFYGYTCSNSIINEINVYKREVNMLIRLIDRDIDILKSFPNAVYIQITSISTNITPEEYEKQISKILNPYYLNSSKMFEKSLK